MTITLCVVRGRPLGRCLEFVDGNYLFGRGSECYIRPLSDWVSRQHCELHVTPSGATIRDLGSHNGTLVNGILIRNDCPLTHGDLLQIGPLVFRVHDPSNFSPSSDGVVDLGNLPDAPHDGSTKTMAPLEPVEVLPGAVA